MSRCWERFLEGQRGEFIDEGMTGDLGWAILAAEKGPTGRPGKGFQFINHAREEEEGWEDDDLVWDMLNRMSVGHLGRSPKAFEIRT